MADKISLYCRENRSDKVYEASIEPKSNKYVVIFAFGRRGSTLQVGTKTSTPVEYDAAKSIFEKLVKEKKSKGYTEGTDGTPYAQSGNEQHDTGIRPQLLNPVNEDQVEGLLKDPMFWMQEKHDGKRVLLHSQGGCTSGINRSGLTIGLPVSVINGAESVGKNFVIDGESIGDRYVAFDLLILNGNDLRGRPYCERLETLVRLIGSGRGTIVSVDTAQTENEKQFQLDRMKRERAEGVVFKRRDAIYTPGRPASGGPQLKFKFVTTGTFIVSKVNAGKRSVALEVIDDAGQGVNVGNVTVPANQKIPSPGSPVEVRYLYCFPKGSLFQPVFLGVRDDLHPAACSTSQIKYKSGDDEA